MQYNIVKPDGNIIAANACQNKDLFWALRGGGGGTWGVSTLEECKKSEAEFSAQVALEVTYKTHPPLKNMVALLAQIDTTSLDQLMDVTSVFLQTIPNITDQGMLPFRLLLTKYSAFFLGVRGYGSPLLPKNPFSFEFIHPNSPSIEFTNSTLGPIYDWIAKNNGTTMSTMGTIHPTFFDFSTQYITDVDIAVPIWLGGKLISSKALLKNSTEISKLMSGPGALSSGINISA